ncbi:MAG TPA: acyltransferase [Candidatus Limnocylindria bacterium]|nr:acyltransferase [Candidatus Limnocylindria bacterium]
MTQRALAAYRRAAAPGEKGRVPALDGLRFLMVFSVACFHLWQQSWLTPSFTVLGMHVSLDPWLRTGYLWVDGMLLLSGFLLYLPEARAREAGRPSPGFGGFYRRRFLRVVPTYVLALLAAFLLVALPERRYATGWEGALDWLAHLTFTHPLFHFSNVRTPLGGVLWTLGVEVQFYLLFPLAARAFRRMPAATYLGAAAAAFGFRALAMRHPETPMLINQLPAFLDVYLAGFMAASVFARLQKAVRDDGTSRVFFTAVLAAAALGLFWLARSQAALVAMEDIRVGQMLRRWPQAALTALVLVSAPLSLGGLRVFLGNGVMAFLSAVSFQFYMWHQLVFTQLKKWRIPPSQSEYPHMLPDRAWQVTYVILGLALALGISALITYLVERPIWLGAAAKHNRRKTA